eukprot:TCONS_00044431-protein
MPLHLKKKLRKNKNKIRTFEIMPPSGTLLPAQKINIQIKFMPSEEVSYMEKLQIEVAQSTQELSVTCRGQGLEPQIEFENSLLQFGPILPYTGKDEVSVKVTNPCAFPIEFYSLEFDKQYVEEEKVLRAMVGYDDQNTVLLPPREPGSLLPKQLLDHYERTNLNNQDNNNNNNMMSSFVEDVQPLTSDPVRSNITLSSNNLANNVINEQSNEQTQTDVKKSEEAMEEQTTKAEENKDNEG